jgi:hypothetical protein
LPLEKAGFFRMMSFRLSGLEIVWVLSFEPDKLARDQWGSSHGEL